MLDVPVGIADGGGFKDWFITDAARASQTELNGKNPLPAADAERYMRVRKMLMLLL